MSRIKVDEINPLAFFDSKLTLCMNMHFFKSENSSFERKNTDLPKFELIITSYQRRHGYHFSLFHNLFTAKNNGVKTQCIKSYHEHEFIIDSRALNFPCDLLSEGHLTVC